MPNQRKNAKVKNAKQVQVYDIIFKSTLEGYVYWRLKNLGISVRYESKQDRIIILKPFEYQGEKIRQATYMPDFTGDKFIIECKGHKTDAWKIREKLIKRRLSKDYAHMTFFMISSQIGFEEILPNILKLYSDEPANSECA